MCIRDSPYLLLLGKNLHGQEFGTTYTRRVSGNTVILPLRRRHPKGTDVQPCLLYTSCYKQVKYKFLYTVEEMLTVLSWTNIQVYSINFELCSIGRKVHWHLLISKNILFSSCVWCIYILYYTVASKTILQILQMETCNFIVKQELIVIIYSDTDRCDNSQC